MNVADANLLQPKTKRQRAILALIAARPVRSQEELGSLLEAQGYAWVNDKDPVLTGAQA